MNSTFGVFKGLYRGRGIYWSGTYNVDGNGEYRTHNHARIAIDKHVAETEKNNKVQAESKAASGDFLVAKRNGDNVTIQTPDGELSMTMREYRQQVFSLEEKYNKNVVWV